MWYKKVFDVGSTYENINELIRALKHISDSYDKYDKYDKPQDMSFDDLDNVIYRAEKTALTLRSAMEFKDKTGDYDSENYRNKYAENNPVDVKFDGKTLKIYTPFTFKRMYRDGNAKENYVLMNYVAAALSQWQNDNKIDLFQAIKPPYDMFIIRQCPAWDRVAICDHDNLENGRIANEIFECLGYSDTAKNMDLHCAFRLCKSQAQAGMVFAIRHRDNDYLEGI